MVLSLPLQLVFPVFIVKFRATLFTIVDTLRPSHFLPFLLPIVNYQSAAHRAKKLKENALAYS
jgi:hypothetical protein